MVYNDSFPEVYENIEDSAKERTPSNHTAKRMFKWELMIMASLVAIAIGIGVGIGIWRHHDHGSHRSSSPNSTNATQYILNDTSLAALVLPDGDRHLFFQDNNGTIRRAIKSLTESQWTISPSLDLGSSPKNHTPIAATVYSWTELKDDGDRKSVTVNT